MASMTFTFIQDLFKGVNNTHWDLGRLASFLALLLVVAGGIHNMLQTGQMVDLMALGGGLAAVLTASAAFIFAKDQARTNAISALNPSPADPPVASVTVNTAPSE